MTGQLQGWLAGAVALAAVGTAEAMPITYDEAVDGELTGFPSFTFDVGSNTIRGSGGRLDIDRFFFTIQSGQELLSVTLAVIDATVIDFGSFADIMHDVGGDATALGDMHLSELSTFPLSQSLFESELPFAAGSYSLGHEVIASKAFFYDYQLTFEVSSLVAVPEPSSLALFGFGLAGFGALGWLRQGRKVRKLGRSAVPS